MKNFGKETTFILIREMAEFAIKRADKATEADENIRIDIPETVRKFCGGKAIDFRQERELVLDQIGEALLTTCEAAEKLSLSGENVARGLETARIAVAEVLTNIELRETFKGTQIPGKLKVAFLGAFNELLQEKFFGGSEESRQEEAHGEANRKAESQAQRFIPRSVVAYKEINNNG
jgi:hypothetical protein